MKAHRRRQEHLSHRGQLNRKGWKLRQRWLKGPGGDCMRLGEAMDDMLAAAHAVVGT